MKTFFFKYLFISTLLLFTSIDCKSIQMTNKILTFVGPTPITVLDVKEEMDRQIFINNRKAFNNVEAIGSYYYQNWKTVLQELIQNEVLFLEAKKMNYALPSHEITKKLNQMYGDNQVEAYKFLSITPEKAKDISEKALLSSHLSWYQIWSKSFLEATPKVVHEAYEEYIANLNQKDKWTYQALYVKGNKKEKVEEVISSISLVLKHETFSNLASLLDRINIDEDQVKVRVSKDITLSTSELTPSLLGVLENLNEGMTSSIVLNKNANSYTGKMLQLKEYKKEPIPEFAELNENLKNNIVNKTGEKLAQAYFSKLYKKYDVSGLYGKSLSMCSLEPFQLENE